VVSCLMLYRLHNGICKADGEGVRNEEMVCMAILFFSFIFIYPSRRP
jgi:hypothetical protein